MWWCQPSCMLLSAGAVAVTGQTLSRDALWTWDDVFISTFASQYVALWHQTIKSNFWLCKLNRPIKLILNWFYTFKSLGINDLPRGGRATNRLRLGKVIILQVTSKFLALKRQVCCFLLWVTKLPNAYQSVIKIKKHFIWSEKLTFCSKSWSQMIKSAEPQHLLTLITINRSLKGDSEEIFSH